ncbi:hypothetical protein GCM10023093_04160 [Nemorincola caseinilytica]|uniref:Seryl-tRNA synthetase n=1 Tax=Nemorincola caseinilytica TaxID=2054315 RepID=A0ABP8N800_9BACT
MKHNTRVNDPAFMRFLRRVKMSVLVLTLMLSGISFNAAAAEKVLTKEQTEARVLAIKERVTEIQAMDMEHMSRLERKEIRTELKNMNKELRQMHPTYIYISGAGLLLIIILLILLL